MSWSLVIMFLSVTFGSVLSEAGPDKKLPHATVVVGTVYCDTCFQQTFSMGSHFISGASIEVECKDKRLKPKFRKEVKTNKQGEFRVQLPLSSVKGCIVKLIKSSEPYCDVASAATSSSLLLKSRNQGLHVFSAGSFSFKPLKKPNLCNQKTRVPKNTRGLIESFPTKTSNMAFGPKKFWFPYTPTYPSVPNPIQSPPAVPSPMQPTPMPMVPNPMQPSPMPMVPSPVQPWPMTPNPIQPSPMQPSPMPMVPMVPNPMQPSPMTPNPMQPWPMPMTPPWQTPSATTPPMVPNPSVPSPWFKFKPPTTSSSNNASP